MRKERNFRVEAVVLRHMDFGEADRLLVLYTRERGKMRSIAKGVRRMKSRKAGHLEPFTRVTLQLAQGRDLSIVTQAETVAAYTTLRTELDLMAQATYVVELLDRFTLEEDGADPALYRLVTGTLDLIDLRENIWLVLRYFEMRLLDSLGFRPRLFHCANCEKEIIPEDQYFSAASGGVLCPACGRGLPGCWDVPEEVLKYMRHFQRSSLVEAKKARPSPAVQIEMESLMQRYLTYLLERRLNAPDFIKIVKPGQAVPLRGD